MHSFGRGRAALVLVTACALIGAMGGPAMAAPGSAPYFDVAKLPPPSVSGKELADSVARFSEAYPHRVTGSPPQLAAANDLLAQVKALGYEAEIVDLPQRSELAGTNTTTAVVATRKGRTRPDEHLVFSSHYDNVPQANTAAYDNASGTMMQLALAKSFANVPTNRTLVFAFYNGEEEGALASDIHAQQFFDQNKKVVGLFGFDMVGIAWPVAAPTDTSCLCVWHGEEDEALDPLLRHINFNVLGFPDAPNLVEMRGQNTRNSDEASWDSRGYPTMRWAGLKTAADYSAYHMPDDTMATIDTVAGGRTFFEQGLRNTLLSSYLTVLALDNEQPSAVVQTVGSGPGPVSFDAGASTDPEGPIGAVTWDFGDGTRGSGTTTKHTYKKKGTYTVTAQVADSLWPQVTTSKKVQVVVTKAVTKKKKAKPKKKKAKKKKRKRSKRKTRR